MKDTKIALSDIWTLFPAFDDWYFGSLQVAARTPNEGH